MKFLKDESTLWSYKYLIIVLILFFLYLYFVLPASAIPAITTYDNSITGDDLLYPHVQEDSSIQFNVTFNESVNYTWIKDGTTISNNYDNYTTTWTSPGYKNVSVYASNPNGTSSQLTWNPWVEQKMATVADEITPLSTTSYNTIITTISSDNPNFETFLGAIATPHTDLYGNLFYVILYGLPFVFIWLFQGSAKIPAVLGVILGPLFLSYFNPDYVPLSILFVILTFVGIIYTVYKERG